MNIQDLIKEIKSKQSFLCVGLDSHLEKMPSHLGDSPDAILKFNEAIINATSDYAVSYKINTAFYEQYGAKGWDIMEQSLAMIPKNCFTIADAKRGDIGNTSSMYAKAFFENMDFDSITVAPYMGKDSVEPFMQFGKTVIVLGLTSNPGSADFQTLKSEKGYFYESVLTKASKWGDENNMMFVTGATKAESLADIRKIIPNHFLLVPGVGAQGGSLEKVIQYGMTPNCGLLVNSSRGIIYASNREDFAEKAGLEAKKIQEQMAKFL